MSENTVVALITLVGSVLGALIGAAMGGNAQGSSRPPVFWILIGAIVGGILTISGLAILGFFPLGDLLSTEVYDNFNNAVYDGNFNTKLWIADVSLPNTIEQKNGLMVLGNEIGSNNVASTLYSKKVLRTNQGFYVESRMLLSGQIDGQYAELDAGLRTSLSDGQTVRYGCWISRSNPVVIWCEVFGRTEKREYGTANKIIDVDQWHTVRIEMTSDIKINFYIDEEKVGSYTPPDPKNFMGSNTVALLEVWSPSKDGIVAKFDYLNIGKLK